VRAAFGEVGNVLALAAQRVCGDHGVAQVADLVQQRPEPGDLVGLAVEVGVGKDHGGGRYPLHATTGGLVLLAHASIELQESFLSSTLRAYTPLTPTDPEHVRRILAGVREHGHVLCDGYVSLETMGVGVPVRSADGEVIAALSIVVPRTDAQLMAHTHALTPDFRSS
jgi:hypothetical protein